MNNEIKRVLNYDKKELIGFNVDRLMPKVIAEIHDSILDRFFQSSKPLIINTGMVRLILPVNKANYLIPATIMVKTFPCLDTGIEIIGFVNALT